MSRVGWISLLVVAGFVAALELLCRTGAIDPRVILAVGDGGAPGANCSPPARPTPTSSARFGNRRDLARAVGGAAALPSAS